MVRPLRLAALLALAAACRYQPSVVPTSGAPDDLRRLAGRWSGTYRGESAQGEGSIVFQVTAKGDSAFGDVLMTQEGQREPLVALDDRAVHQQHVQDVRLLNIAFVRVDGRTVRGVIEPYERPDCRCRAETIFAGRVVADTIRGKYVTSVADGRQLQGEWSVVRERR